MLPLEQRKIFNMYFSQFLSINNSIDELVKYNVIRLYLIKSFRGKSQSLGKPSRGQRT
jgi:ribosomal protein S13